MTPGHRSDAELGRRISALVEYLRTRQREDGEFPTLRHFGGGDGGGYAAPTEFEGWYHFGKCPFAVANIVYHLSLLDLPELREVVRRGCAFLAAGMEGPVARYLAPYDHPVDFPTDIDDTCLAFVALRAGGWDFVADPSLLFGNVHRSGKVYTWFVPRASFLVRPRWMLWLARDLREVTRRLRGYGADVDKLHREYYGSAETPIAANVLLYLGADSRTAPILRRMLDEVAQGACVQQYYESEVVTYFHVARLLTRGIHAVESVRGRIVAELAARQSPSGEVGSTFDTAVAALSLMYFGEWDNPTLERAVRYVAGHPMHEEGWVPLHYCNDREGVFKDGGAELTATFFLEVLHRWRARPGGA